ncbi:MAG: hypothetical protein J6T98_03135 [Salinivirgaceae bacterium]|nr:hypothetical protein [Salinivirgaceae bacterium]
MKKVFLVAALIAVSGVIAEASAQTKSVVYKTTNNNHDARHHRPHKCLSVNTTPKVSYNSTTTALNVSFPSNSQDGKVEIYRNGTKVVNANAAAGATLVYTLRNYGNGCYTIVVSSGSTVVYSNNVTVK